MTNPFEDETETTEDTTVEAPVTDVESNTSGEEDVDVDTDELDEVEDEVEDTGAEKPKAKKAAKEKKEPARAPIAEGYVSPVGFAKLLTAKLTAEGKLEEGKIIPPQQMYSTINSTKNGNNPFPTHEVGGRVNLVIPEEGFAWWDEKDSRVQERKANAATKAAKKKDKPAAEDAEGVTEAEETVGEVTEAE